MTLLGGTFDLGARKGAWPGGDEGVDNPSVRVLTLTLTLTLTQNLT